MTLSPYQKKSMVAFAAITSICMVNKFHLFTFDSPWMNRFMRFYFNDIFGCAGFLLLISIVLSFKPKSQIRINFLLVTLFTLTCGLFWEYVTPLYRTNTVSDPIDILAYLCGELIFWFFLGGKNNPALSNRSKL